MKAFWKVLGFAALAAGLTPYKVEKNEETGENSYQALLWKGTSKDGEDGRHIDINLNEGTLTSKVKGAVEKQKEAHLFSDELSVEYTSGDLEETAEEAAGAADKVAAAAEAADEAAAAAEEAAEAADEASAAAEETAAVAEEAAAEAAEAVEEAAEKAGE